MSKDAKAETVVIKTPGSDEEANAASVKVGAPVDGEKRVSVRPRVNIPRTRIGNTWYSFVAGKEQVVPISVKRHLEEKGIL